MKKIRVVCATRGSEEDFYKERPLGRSLEQFTRSNWRRSIDVRLFPNNNDGLPGLYNTVIDEAAQDPAVLLFIHDDVLITDLYWWEQIHETLRTFDIIGLVGSKRRHPGQLTWWCPTKDMRPDLPLLSGRIQDGEGISVFGTSGDFCKLMDGVLLAANSTTLIDAGLRFDPRFTFDLYDLDFCRQAELKGLTMGTCPISVIHHGSPRRGAYGSTAWCTAAVNYLNKYDEQPCQPE